MSSQGTLESWLVDEANEVRLARTRSHKTDELLDCLGLIALILNELDQSESELALLADTWADKQYERGRHAIDFDRVRSLLTMLELRRY